MAKQHPYIEGVTMNYEQFSEAVASLGIKKSEFLRYLGMVPSTMAKWKINNEVPHLVSLHLDLLVKVNNLLPDPLAMKASKGDKKPDQEEGEE